MLRGVLEGDTGSGPLAGLSKRMVITGLKALRASGAIRSFIAPCEFSRSVDHAISIVFPLLPCSKSSAKLRWPAAPWQNLPASIPDFRQKLAYLSAS